MSNQCEKMNTGRRNAQGTVLICVITLVLVSSAYPPKTHQPPPNPYPSKGYLPPTYPPQQYQHSAPASYSYKQDYGSPYHKCDPYQKPVCALNSTLPFCLKDPEYPLDKLMKIKISDWPGFSRLYADVTVQSADNLVDGVTKEEESSFEYSYYTGEFDISHWNGQAGYICPSEVLYAMPRRAINADGQWRVIYNDGFYNTQTMRMEICLFAGSACRLLPPCYSSKCTQKYIYHKMIAWDPCDEYRGLFMDVFRFPSACSCHVPES